MLRYYKAEADRFRPVDRMVAHTGYLIFARPLLVERIAGEQPAELEKEIFENEGDDNAGRSDL